MKKFKKIITLAVTAMLIFNLGILTSFAETYYSYNGLTFSKANNQITICDFDDSSINLDIPSVILGDTVVAINTRALADDAYIRTAFLPDTIQTIGDFAFNNAINLTTINIPLNVTTLGTGVFQDCSKLSNVTLSSGLQSIGIQTFYRCIGLEKIELPSTVTSIGDLAFARCTSLNYVKIPREITSISANAFKNSPNVVIYGYKGSYAQQYATENSIAFELLNDEYALGDVNLDKNVDIFDATLLQRYLAGMRELSDEAIAVADVSGDGNVSIIDVTRIQLILAKKV